MIAAARYRYVTSQRTASLSAQEPKAGFVSRTSCYRSAQHHQRYPALESAL